MPMAFRNNSDLVSITGKLIEKQYITQNVMENTCNGGYF